MPIEERFLALRPERLVRGPARIRQAHREQENLRPDPAQIDPQIREIHLGLGGWFVRLRHETLLDRAPDRGGDLGPAPGDVIAHARVRHLQAVLVDQPLSHPPRRVALLARRVQVLHQHRVDKRLGRVQPRRDERARLPRRGERRGQSLTNGAAVHPVPGRELADPQPVAAGVAADRLIQLHPRPHHPGPFRPWMAHSITPGRPGWGHLALSRHPGRVAGGANYLCHSIFYPTGVGPNNSVTVGPDNPDIAMWALT
jgi:hypothetical protein